MSDAVWSPRRIEKEVEPLLRQTNGYTYMMYDADVYGLVERIVGEYEAVLAGLREEAKDVDGRKD